MFCTAPMLHAAGREVYKRVPGDFIALPPSRAARMGLTARKAPAWRFIPIRLSATMGADHENRPEVSITAAPQEQPNAFVFHQADPERYAEMMRSCLRNLLAEVGR